MRVILLVPRDINPGERYAVDLPDVPRIGDHIEFEAEHEILRVNRVVWPIDTRCTYPSSSPEVTAERVDDLPEIAPWQKQPRPHMEANQ